MKRTSLVALVLATAVNGCALQQRPQTFRAIRCPAPPAPAPAASPLPVVPAPAPSRPTRIGAQFNWHGDLPLSLDYAELGGTLADDVARLLGAAPHAMASAGARLEVRIQRVSTRSQSAGWFELTAPVTSEIVATARVVRADGGVDAGTFHGEATKRVVYVDGSDHAETLERAYCALLGDFAAHAVELRAAVPVE
ncbi:MAG: hypothetical protein QM704_08590 [Anaeromyxobacteraceae bacterium]